MSPPDSAEALLAQPLLQEALQSLGTTCLSFRWFTTYDKHGGNHHRMWNLSFASCRFLMFSLVKDITQAAFGNNVPPPGTIIPVRSIGTDTDKGWDAALVCLLRL